MFLLKSILAWTLASLLMTARAAEFDPPADPTNAPNAESEPTDAASPKNPQTPDEAAARTCDEKLGARGRAAQMRRVRKLRRALRILQTQLPVAFPEINPETDYFIKMLDRILSKSGAKPSDLVVIAVTGPTLMGKSTWINSFRALVHGEKVFDPNGVLTPIGRQGGTTRRPLIVIPRETGAMFHRRMVELKTRFPNMQELADPKQLLTPGDPLFTLVDGFGEFSNLVIVDTPDISTGNHLVDDEPVNEAAAREALMSADLKLVFLDDNNHSDHGIKKRIARNFEIFGHRDSVFFLKTSAIDDDEFDESHGWLTTAARQVYGLNGEGQAPAQVQAMYGIKLDAATGRRIHPIIKPFKGSPDFPDLFRDVGRRSEEFQKKTIHAVAQSVTEEFRDRIPSTQRTFDALAIYQFALTSIAAKSAPVVPFPYDTVAAHWRGRLSARGGLITRATNLAAKVPTGTMRVVKIRSKKFFSWGKADDQKTFEAVMKEADDKIKQDWVNHFNEIALDLLNNKVTLPKGEAAKLREMITRFNDGLPEDKRVPVAAADAKDGWETVALPDPVYLNEAARASLGKFTSTEFRKKLMDVPLSTADEKIAAEAAAASSVAKPSDQNAAQAKVIDTLRVMTQQRLDAQFASISATNYKSHQWSRDFVTNALSSVTGYAPQAGGLAKFLGILAPATLGTPVVLASIGAGMGASLLIRLHLEGRINRDLKPLLTEWFAGLQTELFKAQSELMLRNALDTVNPRRLDARQHALDAVKTALRDLEINKTEPKK